MRRRTKRLLLRGGIGLLLLVLIAAVTALLYASNYADKQYNTVVDAGPYVVGSEAATLHAELLVGDLHADSLLWDRDLLKPHDWGHVDLPRLQAGGVALQVFGVVTKVPKGDNYESNTGDSDRLTPLMMANRWPPETWSSLSARALWQAHLLNEAAARSPELDLIRTKQQLEAFVRARAENPRRVAALLGTEGLHCLEGDADKLESLFQAGFRVVGLVHFFDNEVGGSCSGKNKGGLTPMGRDIIARAQELGMTLDLAHGSPALFDDVLAAATHPVVVSHGGIKAICPGNRNISDAHIQAVAAGGGVVGVGYWDGALCETSLDAIVRTIRTITDLVGADHVALGSDFDGTIQAPFDTAGVPLITEALLQAGFSKAEIRKIMGENILRVLRKNLPEN